MLASVLTDSHGPPENKKRTQTDEPKSGCTLDTTVVASHLLHKGREPWEPTTLPSAGGVDTAFRRWCPCSTQKNSVGRGIIPVHDSLWQLFQKQRTQNTAHKAGERHGLCTQPPQSGLHHAHEARIMHMDPLSPRLGIQEPAQHTAT